LKILPNTQSVISSATGGRESTLLIARIDILGTVSQAGHNGVRSAAGGGRSSIDAKEARFRLFRTFDHGGSALADLRNGQESTISCPARLHLPPGPARVESALPKVGPDRGFTVILGPAKKRRICDARPGLTHVALTARAISMQVLRCKHYVLRKYAGMAARIGGPARASARSGSPTIPAPSLSCWSKLRISRITYSARRRRRASRKEIDRLYVGACREAD
jgi:hypothetical protein